MTWSLHFYFSLRKCRQYLAIVSLYCLHHHHHSFTRNWRNYIKCEVLWKEWTGTINVKCFVRNRRLHCYHPHPFLAAHRVVRLQHLPRRPFTHSSYMKQKTNNYYKHFWLFGISSSYMSDLSYMHCAVCAHYLEWLFNSSKWHSR
jgi:hypothetical protein